jgi:hypothetical protein
MLPITLRTEDRAKHKLSVRAHKATMRETLREAAEHWHREIAPKHFQTGAAQRYGYQPRSPRTREIKRRLAARGKVADGGALDLVWSGRMRDAVLNAGFIRATAARATLKMVGPFYMKFRAFANRRQVTGRAGASGQQPDKPKELTTVTPGERRTLAKIMRASYLAKTKQ